MTTRSFVTVKICGGMVELDPYDLDDIESAIAAFLSSAGVESESAAPFARSAVTLIDGFQYELCGECMEDLDMHEISPGPLGEAHARCLKCPECGRAFPRLSELTAHLR